MAENSYAENLAKSYALIGEDIREVVQNVLLEERDWDENFQYQPERKALAYILINNAIKLDGPAPVFSFFREIKDSYVEGSFAGFVMEAMFDAFKSAAVSTPLLTNIDSAMADKIKGAPLFDSLIEKYTQILQNDLPAVDSLKRIMPNLATALYASSSYDESFFKEGSWLFTELYPEEALAVAQRQFSGAVFAASHCFSGSNFEENPAIINMYSNYPDIYKEVVKQNKIWATKGNLSPISSIRTMMLADQDLQKSFSRYETSRDKLLKDYIAIMGKHLAAYKKDQNLRASMSQKQNCNTK